MPGQAQAAVEVTTHLVDKGQDLEEDCAGRLTCRNLKLCDGEAKEVGVQVRAVVVLGSVLSVALFGAMATACALQQQQGTFWGLKRFGGASLLEDGEYSQEVHCHDGEYSGEAAMNSLFVSFGTQWSYHERFGGMVASVEDQHNKSMYRSLPFNITGRTSFSVKTTGGMSKMRGVAASAADFPGPSSERGFIGVAVRSLRDGKWAVVKSRAKTGVNAEIISFTPDDLKPLIGREVTVDIVDTFTGIWGWLAVDDFILAGSCRTEYLATRYHLYPKKAQAEAWQMEASAAMSSAPAYPLGPLASAASRPMSTQFAGPGP